MQTKQKQKNNFNIIACMQKFWISEENTTYFNFLNRLGKNNMYPVQKAWHFLHR